MLVSEAELREVANSARDVLGDPPLCALGARFSDHLVRPGVAGIVDRPGIFGHTGRLGGVPIRYAMLLKKRAGVDNVAPPMVAPIWPTSPKS